MEQLEDGPRRRRCLQQRAGWSAGRRARSDAASSGLNDYLSQTHWMSSSVLNIDLNLVLSESRDSESESSDSESSEKPVG